MPSTFIDGDDCSPVTQQSLGDAVKACWVSKLGYTALDDYTASSIRYLVFGHITNTKTYGGVCYRIEITSAFAVSQTFGTSYTAATKTLANAGTAGATATFANTSPIKFKCIRGASSEFDWVIPYQLASSVILGWLRCKNLNDVDENFYCAYLQPSAMSSKTWRGVANGFLLRGVSSYSSWA
ncbi:hypothetical protein [Cylindrospermum sp. FACHB-282]|uniref:hypothetical protein n=1 Tax=Cylindrospermum sp. FACHB-282 TaxID=2692794 RepID=UPI00168A3E99|nr:hypothetical protein [Cylindrospermum sp. FACHB-282]MBD2388869.1 hypothetical protein [Cylindrospermum sp. FACHB-282]